MVRTKKGPCYYCPVCGAVLEFGEQGWTHGFSHPLHEWQTAYDAEDFVEGFLGLDDFYEKYNIVGLDTRKMLLQVGLSEGVDRRGRESTGGGSRETATGLLLRANKALGVEYFPDFSNKGAHDKKRAAIVRSRLRSAARARARREITFREGDITIVSDPHHYATRDVYEAGIIEQGGIKVGRFELDVPYRTKAQIRLAQSAKVVLPSNVVISWFEIYKEVRHRGLARRSYELLERMILERYDPREINLTTGIWDIEGFWRRMGFFHIGKYSGPGKRYSMIKKFPEKRPQHT